MERWAPCRTGVPCAKLAKSQPGSGNTSWNWSAVRGARACRHGGSDWYGNNLPICPVTAYNITLISSLSFLPSASSPTTFVYLHWRIIATAHCIGAVTTIYGSQKRAGLESIDYCDYYHHYHHHIIIITINCSSHCYLSKIRLLANTIGQNPSAYSTPMNT